MSTQTDSPALQRLAKVLGWSEIPTLTPEEEEEFRQRMRQAEQDCVEYYGEKALIPVTPERIRRLHGL